MNALRFPFLLVVLLGMLLGCGTPLSTLAADKQTPPKPPTKTEAGIASWFRARRPLTGAHRTLPLGSKVKVIARNGRFVVVTIKGRGPFVKGRVIDLSSDAFTKLASLGTGLLKVRLELVNRVPASPAETGRVGGKPTPAKHPPVQPRDRS